MYTYTIYRLEREHRRNKVGLGAYRFNTSFKFELCDKHSCQQTHPNLREDFNTMETGYNMYFACHTIPKFKQWFDGLLERAVESGLSIAKYEVKRIVIGHSNKQCVFDKNDIVSKEYITLKQLK